MQINDDHWWNGGVEVRKGDCDQEVAGLNPKTSSKSLGGKGEALRSAAIPLLPRCEPLSKTLNPASCSTCSWEQIINIPNVD